MEALPQGQSTLRKDCPDIRGNISSGMRQLMSAILSSQRFIDTADP